MVVGENGVTRTAAGEGGEQDGLGFDVGPGGGGFGIVTGGAAIDDDGITVVFPLDGEGKLDGFGAVVGNGGGGFVVGAAIEEGDGAIIDFAGRPPFGQAGGAKVWLGEVGIDGMGKAVTVGAGRGFADSADW